MRICKRCLQPDSRPAVYFENDLCGACLWEDEKQTLDWETRERELEEIAEWAKKNARGNYHCAIGVSGGKDSTKQAITARDRLGLRCLLVNCEPPGITEIGRYNIENLKNLGFDVMSIRPNPKVLKKLMKWDFYNHLNPVKVTEFPLYASTYILAEKFDIPLIIQGDNPGLLLGTRLATGTDSNALRANELQTLSRGSEEYLKVEGIQKEDLYLFGYDRKRLEEKGTRGIWLQYFLKEWSAHNNAEFSQKYGFRIPSEENFDPIAIGTYKRYAALDTELNQVNKLLKYIKFGFGQCMDHVGYDIREGRITKEEGIELLKKYDGKCDEKYIKKCCDYIEISLDEFWKFADKFRGSMWVRDESNNWKNTYCDILEKEIKG